MGRKSTGYLVQRGSVWSVRTRINGVETWISTGKTDRAEAEEERARIMAPLELQHRADGLRLLAARIADADATTAAAQAGSAPTIADTWRAYLASPLRNDPGALTMESYARHWQRFARWASESGIDTVDKVAGAEAAQYAETLRQYSGNTYNKHITFLSAMWRALRLPADVWDGIRH